MGAPVPQSAPPSSEEKRIYRVPVFSAEFCQALLEELEHFEQSDMPKGRPNTMNNYGVGEACLCTWRTRTVSVHESHCSEPRAPGKQAALALSNIFGKELWGCRVRLPKSPC